MAEQRYWFRAKRYGWGWYPATREGWLCGGCFVLLEVLGAWLLIGDNPEHTAQAVLFFIWTAICTAILGVISYKKGEKPRWRWGK